MAAADFKKIIQELVVPELQDIKLKVGTIEVEIRRLDEKVDNLDRRLNEKIDGLDKRIDSLRNEFSVRFESLEREVSMAINIHERLAALEAKIGH